MLASLYEGGRQDLPPIATAAASLRGAIVTSRTPSSPIRAAPITAKRRKGTSRRGYYRAQFENGWARYCAAGVTPSQPSNVAYIGNR